MVTDKYRFTLRGRLKKQNLVRGWCTWFGAFQERQHLQKLARLAVERLMKPKLTASFAGWRADWAEAEVQL